MATKTAAASTGEENTLGWRNIVISSDSPTSPTGSPTAPGMGAHTIGEMSQSNSGFDKSGGWSNNRRRSDNGYFDGIVGGKINNEPLENIDIETLIREGLIIIAQFLISLTVKCGSNQATVVVKGFS